MIGLGGSDVLHRLIFHADEDVLFYWPTSYEWRLSAVGCVHPWAGLVAQEETACFDGELTPAADVESRRRLRHVHPPQLDVAAYGVSETLAFPEAWVTLGTWRVKGAPKGTGPEEGSCGRQLMLQALVIKERMDTSEVKEQQPPNFMREEAEDECSRLAAIVVLAILGREEEPTMKEAEATHAIVVDNGRAEKR